MITLTREEAQQVLDAFINMGQRAYDAMGGDAFHECNIAVSRLRARLAQPEPEPVAWLHRFIEHGISIGKKPVDLDKYPDRWMPVYKDPTPCQTCEALARTVMMDQTSHDTAQPQREWQGLETDGESQEIWLKVMEETKDKRHLPVLEFAVAIEAKLKEKNT